MKCEIYKDKKGEYRWRMKARNGLIVADGAEGYTRRSGARRAFVKVVKLMAVMSFTRIVDIG